MDIPTVSICDIDTRNHYAAAKTRKDGFVFIETRPQYVRYIVMAMGYWGKGETLEEARNKCVKAGASRRQKMIGFRFASPLQFADENTPEEELETHADCWIDPHGMLAYARCTIEELGKV